MNISQFKKIVDNYLAGNATRREAALLHEWLNKAFDEKGLPADTEEQRLLALEHLRSAIRPRQSRIVWMRAAAASALLLVTGALGHTYRYELANWIDPIPMQTVTALKYQVRKLVLPDSSVVVLNGGTTVIYPQHFRGRERNVRVNGEAFFEVTKQAGAPFVISGPNLHVQVLGTSFVVTDSSSVQMARVSVKTGKVAVTAEAGGFVSQQLGANEELVFNREKQEMKVYMQQEVNTGWITKKLMFNESALSAVFSEIEKMYGVRIIFKRPVTADQKFTGAFETDDTLDDILKVISLSYRLTVHKNKDGTILIK